jgi:hypothetical protein
MAVKSRFQPLSGPQINAGECLDLTMNGPDSP